MEAVATKPGVAADDMRGVLPLYAASLLVTLSGLGAVSVTFATAAWTPILAALAVLGHGVSYALRRMRIPAEVVFYPIMVLGCGLVLQLAVSGGVVPGLDIPLLGMPPDMAMATIISAVAVVRAFTLLSNTALLFSPVPAITMLALVGTTNPNAEVPLFFGLLILGSLFLAGYEAHLRRIALTGREATPLVFHLLGAWCVTLSVAAAALLFPLLIQPVLGPISPFGLPVMGRLKSIMNFTQVSNSQAPVGQGPITLSQTPVFEVHMNEAGLLRTGVFTQYTGRSWTMESMPATVAVDSTERVRRELRDPETGIESDRLWRFQFEPDPEATQPIRTHEVRQQIFTRGYGPQGLPALGAISELYYPRQSVFLHISGTVSGHAHLGPNRAFEIVSRVPDWDPNKLRQTPMVDPDQYDFPESLEVPQSTMRVQELAREITQEVPNAYDKIQTILRYIEQNCQYTLQEEMTPPGQDAAEYYLFHTKRGACDLAATASAVMARAVGIPARVAVGYVAEEPLPSGEGFMIRQEHAHMWLEAFFPGYGWVSFNPSPPMANVKDTPWQTAWYALRGFFSRIGGGGLDALLLLIVILITFGAGAYRVWLLTQRWWARRTRERRLLASSPAAATAFVYGRTLRMLERRGWRREAAETPQEYLERLRSEWAKTPTAFRAMEVLTEYFQAAHYGGRGSADGLRRANEAAQSLRRLAPRRPKPRKRAVVPTPAGQGA